MVKEKQDVAPLGLDYEMPETVWVWTADGVRSCNEIYDGELLKQAALSLKGLLVVIRPDFDREWTSHPGKVIDGWPMERRIDDLLSELVEPVGVIVFDDWGREIKRQYVR